MVQYNLYLHPPLHTSCPLRLNVQFSRGIRISMISLLQKLTCEETKDGLNRDLTSGAAVGVALGVNVGIAIDALLPLWSFLCTCTALFRWTQLGFAGWYNVVLSGGSYCCCFFSLI
jgi:hypothetical protein